MFHKEIQLLQKSLPRVPRALCQSALTYDVDDLTRSVFAGGKLAVIDDNRTGEAFGNQVFRALKSAFAAEHIQLSDFPEADEKIVQYIRAKTTSCDALVAVGGGTINDLVKYASFLDKKPYIVFPTAASMNGYLSANASITVEGYKKTMPAQMPEAVFCDLSVIAAAPSRLSKSGLGDSLARPTAQSDWLLSHLLLDTLYNEVPFTLLKSYEADLFENARGIAKADPASIQLLMHVLLLSGLGMTIAGGSYPASQAEHMIAHAYGMMQAPHAGDVLPPLHGEEIGVTTLFMSQIQEQTLHGRPTLRRVDFPEEEIEKYFGNPSASEAKKVYAQKKSAILQKKLDVRLRENGLWESIAGHIEAIHLPTKKIQSILKAAEAPAVPQALHWDNKIFAAATAHARFLRDRFTFLDLTLD